MRASLVGVLLLFVGSVSAAAETSPMSWWREWPNTDFAKTSIDLNEILSGGPPKDGIPSIDRPKFVSIAQATDLSETEPVIGLLVDGDARAYPLRILMWHEIVNDRVGGVPVAVTYCPLCNSAVVFERRVNGRETTFGTTGKLRHSDMVMYDRLTESWWQQFLGEAIVGAATGARLKTIPARLESFANFKARAPQGKVLVPADPGAREYGRNPYTFYDTAAGPYSFFTGPFPDYIDPMVRVIVVDGRAWAMPVLRRKGRIEVSNPDNPGANLILSWTAGQASALDQPTISRGRDVGNVVVQRKHSDGRLSDAVYDVTFAFVYHVFHPNRRIVTE